MNGDMVPTAKLRWIVRLPEMAINEVRLINTKECQVLQQWWAPDMPAYMSSGEGEWRDVPVEFEP